MIRSLKRKHGVIYLIILFIIGFVFVSKCLETRPIDDQSRIKQTEITVENITNMLNSDSVISRRNAFALIEKKKIKELISNLENILLSHNYTQEDRRLSARTIGTICDLNHIKKYISFLNNKALKDSNMLILELISTYLDFNSKVKFKELLKSEFSIFINLIQKGETPQIRRLGLEIIEKLKLNDAFDTVLALITNFDVQSSAITTLPAITLPKQKNFVLHNYKKMLETETNVIVRRAIRRGIYYLEQPDFLKDLDLVNIISDLGSNFLDIRRRAFNNFIQYETSTFLPYLKSMLFDFESRVRLMAIRIINYKKLTGFEEDFEKIIPECLRYFRNHPEFDINLDIVKAILKSFSINKNDKAFEILKRYIYDNRVREQIYESISVYDKNDEIIKILENSILNESEEIKTQIAEYLFRKKHFDFFIKNIRNFNEYLRILAIRYTAKINTQEAKTSLKQAYDIEPENSKWKNYYKQAINNNF